MQKLLAEAVDLEYTYLTQQRFTERPKIPFQALIIVYPVSWVLTGGMMILYYFWQRGKLFGKDSERPALIG